MGIAFEQVEIVKNKTGCSYREAKEMLVSTGGVDEAIAYFEDAKNESKHSKQKGVKQIGSALRDTSEKIGNVGSEVLETKFGKNIKQTVRKSGVIAKGAGKRISEVGADVLDSKLATNVRHTVEKVGMVVVDTGEMVGEFGADVKDSKIVQSAKVGAVKAGETITDTGEKIGDAGAEALNTKLLKTTMDEYAPVWEDYDRESVILELSCEELHENRQQSILEISSVERLVNSIANTPKSFADDFAVIKLNVAKFNGVAEFAEDRLEELKKSAGAAGAGVTAGVGVAALAPTAAIAIATTFGTASTGTAISALGGAAASNAALAWLGGGAVAAGGGGVAAGNALLALAGPIGWSIAGVSIIGSGILISFQNKKKASELHELTVTLHKRLKDNRIIQAIINGSSGRCVNEINP